MFMYFHTLWHKMHYCGRNNNNGLKSNTANLVLSCSAPSRQKLGDAVSWSYVDNKARVRAEKEQLTTIFLKIKFETNVVN